MDEIESTKSMIFLDATEEVDFAILARVTQDRGVVIKNDQLVLVGFDLDVLDGNDADNCEEGSVWFVALGTSACMVVKNVAGDRNLHFLGCAETPQGSTGKIPSSLRDAIINEGMERL